MSEEELRKIAKEEMAKSIMDNLDSALIFTYIKNLEEENKQLKFDYKQAEELKHFFMNEKNKLQEKNEELQKELNGKVEALDRAMNCVDYISKDKIKDKIKEYKENIEIFKNLHKADGVGITECKILGLKELLEEN